MQKQIKSIKQEVTEVEMGWGEVIWGGSSSSPPILLQCPLGVCGDPAGSLRLQTAQLGIC